MRAEQMAWWRMWLAVGVLVLAGAAPGWADGPGKFDPVGLEARAQGGDVGAALDLGTLDYVGLGVVQDYIGAANWLKRAADAGDAQAQWELGFLYQTGSYAQGPPPPNPQMALPYYTKAAAQGNGWGEFALAELYQNGLGVTQDAAKAAALFAQAAAQGVKADPASTPLNQMQQTIYARACRLTGQTQWVDMVSKEAGGGS